MVVLSCVLVSSPAAGAGVVAAKETEQVRTENRDDGELE